MAGCTDPEYSDSSCPHKDNSGQQLLGLVQCSDSQADGTALWSACPGPTTKTALGAPSQCSCSGTTDGLLWMTTSLSALATLPTAIRETIQFNQGHYPSVKTSASQASTFASTKADSTTTATGTATGTSSSSNGTAAPTTSTASAAGNSTTAGGLSTGAEVGIGIGVTLLGLCATGLAIFAILAYRRKSWSAGKGKGASVVAENNIMGHPAHGNSSQVVSIHHPSSPGSAFGGNHHHNTDSDSFAYTGYKSELPADPQFLIPAELPADDISPVPQPQGASRPVTDLVSPLSPEAVGWRSPRTVSSASSLRLSASCPSPPPLCRSTQATTGWHEGRTNSTSYPQGRTDAGGGPLLGSIPELHG